MPYSQFTFQELETKLGLELSGTKMFADTKAIQPSSWLSETLDKGKKLGFINEKERSERIINPILTELSDINNHQFIIYSGRNLDVDIPMGLNGECDFILSFGTVLEFVQAPVFAITEAKKEDIDSGTIQCAAQLYAAQRYNLLQKADIKVVYGCTTTAEVWRFLKLKGNHLILDEDRYYITQPEILLGVLQKIIDNCRNDI